MQPCVAKKLHSMRRCRIGKAGTLYATLWVDSCSVTQRTTQASRNLSTVSTGLREQTARRNEGRLPTCDRLTDAAHALGVFPRLALPEVRVKRDERVPQCSSRVVLAPPQAQVRHQVGGLANKNPCETD